MHHKDFDMLIYSLLSLQGHSGVSLLTPSDDRSILPMRFTSQMKAVLNRLVKLSLLLSLRKAINLLFVIHPILLSLAEMCLSIAKS